MLQSWRTRHFWVEALLLLPLGLLPHVLAWAGNTPYTQHARRRLELRNLACFLVAASLLLPGAAVKVAAILAAFAVLAAAMASQGVKSDVRHRDHDIQELESKVEAQQPLQLEGLPAAVAGPVCQQLNNLAEAASARATATLLEGKQARQAFEDPAGQAAGSCQQPAASGGGATAV